MSFFFIDDAAAPTSTSYVGSASSSGETITVPATAQAGDIAVLYDMAFTSGATAPSLVTPSGWTNGVNEVVTTVARLAVATKILTSGDPGAVLTGMVGVNSTDKHMLVFRTDAAVSNLAVSAFTKEFTNTEPSSQVIDPSGQLPPVIVLGGCGSSASASFSTVSPAFDAQIASTSGLMRIGYKLYNLGSTPASHTIDMADLGSRNSLWGCYLTLT